MAPNRRRTAAAAPTAAPRDDDATGSPRQPRQQKRPGHGWSAAAALVATVVVCGAAGAWWWWGDDIHDHQSGWAAATAAGAEALTASEKRAAAASSRTLPVAGAREAEVVALPSPDADYGALARADAPLVLRNSLVTTWPALQKWTPRHLADALPVSRAYVRPPPPGDDAAAAVEPADGLPGRRDPSEFITWHDNKPLAPFVAPKAGAWAAFNTVVNVSTASLFEPGPPFLYNSEDVSTLHDRFPGAVRDIQPLRPFAAAATGLQVNLWMGAAPVQTYIHFDASYNFFAQLRGRKRFTLFPPNASMYLWPCLHPHIGHAQVDWRDDANLTERALRFPRFSPQGAVTAEVGRGEMLVLPPYWFHHVETIESPSVSVNMWSDAPAYAALEKAYADVPVPLEADWPASRRAAAAADFLTRVADAVLKGASGGDVAAFAGDLFHQRWERLTAEGHLTGGGKLDLSTLCGPSAVKAAVDGGDVDRDKNAARAADLAPIFAEMEPVAVRLISLGNYVERVAAAAVGPESAGEFVRECLASSPPRADE